MDIDIDYAEPQMITYADATARKIHLAFLTLTCMPVIVEISECLSCLYAVCVSYPSEGTGLCFSHLAFTCVLC